jgi:hypothetical protein
MNCPQKRYQLDQMEFSHLMNDYFIQCTKDPKPIKCKEQIKQLDVRNLLTNTIPQTKTVTKIGDDV